MLNGADSGVLLLVYVLGAAAFMLLERRRLKSIFQGVGRPAAYFAVISVCLLLVSQTYLPDGSLYPYASWNMYTQRLPIPTTWQVELVRASGRRETIPIARIIRGPNPRAAMRLVTDAAWRFVRADSAASADRRTELEAVLDLIARLDAHASRSDPVQWIDVHQCTIPRPPPWTRDSFRCELVLHYDIDPGLTNHAS